MGGPKDGEIIYCRPEFLAEEWSEPVLTLRLPSEPNQHYTYMLEDYGPHMCRYKYIGLKTV